MPQTFPVSAAYEGIKRNHEGTGTDLRKAKLFPLLWHKPCWWPGVGLFTSPSMHLCGAFPSFFFLEYSGSDLPPQNEGTEMKHLLVKFSLSDCRGLVGPVGSLHRYHRQMPTVNLFRKEVIWVFEGYQWKGPYRLHIIHAVGHWLRFLCVKFLPMRKRDFRRGCLFCLDTLKSPKWVSHPGSSCSSCSYKCWYASLVNNMCQHSFWEAEHCGNRGKISELPTLILNVFWSQKWI